MTKRIAITGAAGQISYSLLFRICSGEIYGPDQKVSLQLLELPAAQKVLTAVCMELEDCGFPLLEDVVCTTEPARAFADADAVLLLGAKPRGPGMERSDLLAENGKIFKALGQDLGKCARPDAKVVVVGNPANTNALILSHHAKGLNPQNITALTRLDHNRALMQLAAKTSSTVADIRCMTIWGNHSGTQVPDLEAALVGDEPAPSLVEESWTRNEFIPLVANRGTEIIKWRGSSSAASAANAVIDHMRDWIHGSLRGDWRSMAVATDGSYDISEGLIYSFPVICRDGDYQIVEDLEPSDFIREKMAASERELLEERQAVSDLLA